MYLRPVTTDLFRSSFSGVPHSNLNFQTQSSQMFLGSSFYQNQKQKKNQIFHEQHQQQKVCGKVNNSVFFPKRIRIKQKSMINSQDTGLNVSGIWKSTISNKLSSHPFLQKEKGKQKQTKKDRFIVGQKNNINHHLKITNKNENDKENMKMDLDMNMDTSINTSTSTSMNISLNKNSHESFNEIRMETETETETKTETVNGNKQQDYFFFSQLNQITNKKNSLFRISPNHIKENNKKKIQGNNLGNLKTHFQNEKTKETAKTKKEKIQNILNNLNSSNYGYSNHEYLTEQFESYLIREKRYQTDPFYLNRQKFTELERVGVLNWLSLICEEHELQQETFLIAINIFDRYLSLYDHFPLQLLKVLAVVSLFIASKSEEVYSLTVSDLINILDDKITRETIFKFEMSIFNSLNFRISPVTTNNWLQLYLQKLIWHDPNLLPQDLKEICVTKCEFNPNEKIFSKIKNQKSQKNDNYDQNYTKNYNKDNYTNNENNGNRNNRNYTENKDNNNENEKKKLNNFSHFEKISNQTYYTNNNILKKNKKQPFSSFNRFQNSNLNFKNNIKNNENNNDNINVKNYNKIIFNNNKSENSHYEIGDCKKRKPKSQFENLTDLKPDLKKKRFYKKNNQILNFVQFQQKQQLKEERAKREEGEELNNSFFKLKKNEQQLAGIDNENVPKFCSGKIINQTKSFDLNTQFTKFNYKNNNNNNNNNNIINSNNKMKIEINKNYSNKYFIDSKTTNQKLKQINQNKENFEKEEDEEEEEEIVYELFNENNSKNNCYPLNFNSFSQKNKPKKICKIKKKNKFGSYNQIVYKIKEFPKKLFFQFSQLLTVLTMDPTSLQFMPSQIAASIFYLYFEEDFNNITQKITFFSKNELQNCIDWVKMYEKFLFEPSYTCSLFSYDHDDVNIDNDHDAKNIDSYNLHLHNEQCQKFVKNLFQNLGNFSSQNFF
ncbi:g1/s-specific cyclin-e [Anaeramoeba flamelloides]|uniref:G1/s-specific cyclin-e n=1 Tax=Anaeramoeba flamelloides TaxID=1746091 RepID=A0ABQ8Y4W6_9EUKA|nr:g1/s-specific cyclin-e [Anaeramoeba flamelloides]